MRSITIDIINEKALNLLRDMEILKLIKLRWNKEESKSQTTDWSKFKGAMTRQSLSDTDQQLKELRNDWE